MTQEANQPKGNEPHVVRETIVLKSSFAKVGKMELREAIGANISDWKKIITKLSKEPDFVELYKEDKQGWRVSDEVAIYIVNKMLPNYPIQFKVVKKVQRRRNKRKKSKE